MKPSHNILSFGINGSLRRREVSQPQPYTEYYLFNSASNLKAYSNNGLDFAYYGYNATLPKYAFNAKELDEETGMYYYEARYPIQFGGKRAPESMREQCKDPFNPKYKDTWKVAANELTWLVRSVTVKTVINVTKDGDITMNHSFKDKLDLRPSEGRSMEYNRVTSIMGFIYHDVLGGNDEMTVSASWSNSFPLKKPTNTSNR